MRFRYAAAMIGVLATAPAFADQDWLSFHGFGNQDYWKSSSNSIDGSGGAGTWDNDFLGLVMSARISDKSKVWAQLQASANENVRPTWFFVDYAYNDNLRFQVGRVKFPFGIYNEYVSTRALQVAATLPLVYAPEADMTYDAFNGVQVTYDWDAKSYGRVSFQVFGGNIFNPVTAPSNVPFPDQFQEGNLEAVTDDHHVFGGKGTWETPIEGLRLMLSGNRTRVMTTADNGQTPGLQGDEDRLMLSVDFLRDNLDLKSEYNLHSYPGLAGFKTVDQHAWYVQAGYAIGQWMPYARYDSIVTDNNQSSDPSYFQRTFVVGFNRKLGTNLNFRAETHFNDGYAMPVAAGETAAGAGRSNWKLYVAQVNFMF